MHNVFLNTEIVLDSVLIARTNAVHQVDGAPDTRCEPVPSAFGVFIN
ncbi:hypothetical protein CES86_0288 [Brucella lupini]|uniref:Uncharacterized protein n=1 Tax=Brucella lupini TaxID=255457 RepID=A0A256GZK5_9HYPH|nr:hypothetical protein CES86_0288 [Brucella lupini]